MRFLLLVASMLLISACGKTPAPEPAPTTPPVEQKNTTVIEPQFKVYNDAKQVQGSIDATQKKREAEMDSSGL